MPHASRAVATAAPLTMALGWSASSGARISRGVYMLRPRRVILRYTAPHSIHDIDQAVVSATRA